MIAGFAAANAWAASNIELPPGPGRELVYGQCRTCHDLQYLKESAGITRDAWSDILDSMSQYGMRLNPDQRAKILDYLAAYLGPNPPPAASAGSVEAAPQKLDGAALYRDQCAACHQEKGEGVAGQFPPLAGNADLFLSPDYLARVVLFGLRGKITVKGAEFSGAMPEIGASLSDDKVAAIVNYARGAFGKDAARAEPLKPMDAAEVAELRVRPSSAEEVHAERGRLALRRANP
jgi:mono/diheme cytochrome c family protein